MEFLHPVSLWTWKLWNRFYFDVFEVSIAVDSRPSRDPWWLEGAKMWCMLSVLILNVMAQSAGDSLLNTPLNAALAEYVDNLHESYLRYTVSCISFCRSGSIVFVCLSQIRDIWRPFGCHPGLLVLLSNLRSHMCFHLVPPALSKHQPTLTTAPLAALVPKWMIPWSW